MNAPECLHSSHATGWQAHLRLGFARRDGASRLVERRHNGPLVVQKSLHPEGPEVCHSIIVHPPGGIAGGDQLSMDIEVGSGAHALLTTPGATKWYRSIAGQARQSLNLRVADEACLEWLPQENIVFNNSDGALNTRIKLGREARAIVWEMTCLGRTASGERFLVGQHQQSIELWQQGRLCWQENMCLQGSDPRLSSRAGLAGHSVFGTICLAGIGPDTALITQLREVFFSEGMAGVTALPDATLIRALGDDTEAMRRYFIAIWRIARPYCVKRAAVTPRIWST